MPQVATYCIFHFRTVLLTQTKFLQFGLEHSAMRFFSLLAIIDDFLDSLTLS